MTWRLGLLRFLLLALLLRGGGGALLVDERRRLILANCIANTRSYAESYAVTRWQ